MCLSTYCATDRLLVDDTHAWHISTSLWTVTLFQPQESAAMCPYWQLIRVHSPK